MADEKNASERSAEQQAAFNKEALKSQETLDDLSNLAKRLVDELKEGATTSQDLAKKLKGIPTDVAKSAKTARELNTALGQGENITKKLNTEILESGRRIEELEYQRQVNLSKLTKAKKKEDIEAILQANRAIDTQLKGENLVRKQLQLLEDYVENEKAITDELKKQNNLGNLLSKKLKGAFEPLTKLVTVSGIFEAIVSGMVRADKASVDLSKNLGVAATDAYLMTLNMQGMALASSNVNVTMKNMVTAMNDLNTATGLVANYSADTLETQIMLTKQFGLTGEEAAGIYKFSVLTGKSSSTINDEMVGAFVATRNSAKVGANFKAVMAEASKVSGQLAANFKNNPAAITAAVVQMKALGTSLEQTKNQGATLLDFESSIENELKAELLTGEQLNLEKARAAALMGDQVALAEELSNQGMTLEKFSSMNVLAQDAYAKAVGLNSDQLSDQLTKQKMAVESGKSLAEITKDDALAAQKRQDVQDRFNAAIEKLQDLFGTIGTLLSPILSIFSYLIGNSYVLYGILGLWLARTLLIGGGFKGMLGSIKSMGTGIMNKILGKGGAAATTAPTTTPTTTPTTGKGGGMLSSLKGISTTDMIKGAAAILILSAALYVAAKAFQEFATVKWEDVAKGVVGIGALAGIAMLLGQVQKEMIKGAIAVAILGVALIPFAYAMSLIAGLDIGAVLAAAAGLVIFGAAVFALGALMFTGVGAVLFGAGLLALIALGGALIVLGAGLKAVSEGGKGVAQLFNDLSQLDADKLDRVAPALKSIGQAVLYLGAGGVMSAIGKLLGGDSPAKIIQDIAASADGITQAASGLQLMATALQQVSTALSGIDVSKLEALDKFASNRASESVVGGIVDFITAPIKAIGSMIEGAGGNDNTGMIKAINEVRDAVNKLYAKDQSINMDGKKVGTTLVQSSYKVA